MVSTILAVIQIILSILLMTAILLQQKGGGLGAAFGGSSNIYSTKRGIDKILYRATIVMAVLFLLLSLVGLLV